MNKGFFPLIGMIFAFEGCPKYPELGVTMSQVGELRVVTIQPEFDWGQARIRETDWFRWRLVIGFIC